MSQLRIKVLGQIYVDENTAEEVERMMSDPAMKKANPFIRTKKWSGNLSEITGILHEVENKSEDKTKDQLKEYNDWRARFLKQTTREKAEDIQMFNFLYIATEDSQTSKPSQELISRVKYTQEKFFAKNPYRCFCDAYLLMELFETKKNKKISPWSRALLRIIERQIAEDMACARFKH